MVWPFKETTLSRSRRLSRTNVETMRFVGRSADRRLRERVPPQESRRVDWNERIVLDAALQRRGEGRSPTNSVPRIHSVRAITRPDPQQNVNNSGRDARWRKGRSDYNAIGFKKRQMGTLRTRMVGLFGLHHHAAQGPLTTPPLPPWRQLKHLSFLQNLLVPPFHRLVVSRSSRSTADAPVNQRTPLKRF
ncbi:hypothetical protein VTN00DRAFT_5660 [Thermoascus crustaceus]|uniref:uncharacterized protein n=1 Tax=Thermoascus crustaceus TaxID=5088 RepID=UPI0037446759